MNRSQKFLESMKSKIKLREEFEKESEVQEDPVAPVEEPSVEDEIDTDDAQILAVLDMFFSRISRKPVQVKADKLQQLVHRLINSMINMPRGEKEVRTALKLAVKGVNEKKKEPVVEGAEEGQGAMKFAKAVAKIESKSAQKQAEMLSALLHEVVGKINELPQSSKIMRELGPVAMDIATNKGQEPVEESSGSIRVYMDDSTSIEIYDDGSSLMLKTADVADNRGEMILSDNSDENKSTARVLAKELKDAFKKFFDKTAE